MAMVLLGNRKCYVTKTYTDTVAYCNISLLVEPTNFVGNSTFKIILTSGGVNDKSQCIGEFESLSMHHALWLGLLLVFQIPNPSA
jgi:hypothetical protein